MDARCFARCSAARLLCIARSHSSRPRSRRRPIRSSPVRRATPRRCIRRPIRSTRSRTARSVRRSPVGRTTAVAGATPIQPSYYAGGAGGGIFKSADGGASWRAGVRSRAVAPVGAISGVAARSERRVGRHRRSEPAQRGRGRGGHLAFDRRRQRIGRTPGSTMPARSRRSRSIREIRASSSSASSATSFATRRCAASSSRATRPRIGRAAVPGLADRRFRSRARPGPPSTLFAGLWRFRRQPWTLTAAGRKTGSTAPTTTVRRGAS